MSPRRYYLMLRPARYLMPPMPRHAQRATDANAKSAAHTRRARHTIRESDMTTVQICYDRRVAAFRADIVCARSAQSRAARGLRRRARDGAQIKMMMLMPEVSAARCADRGDAGRFGSKEARTRSARSAKRQPKCTMFARTAKRECRRKTQRDKDVARLLCRERYVCDMRSRFIRSDDDRRKYAGAVRCSEVRGQDEEMRRR